MRERHDLRHAVPLSLAGRRGLEAPALPGGETWKRFVRRAREKAEGRGGEDVNARAANRRCFYFDILYLSKQVHFPHNLRV